MARVAGLGEPVRSDAGFQPQRLIAPARWPVPPPPPGQWPQHMAGEVADLDPGKFSRRVGLITHGQFCGRHRRSQPIHWSRAARALAAPASKTQPLIWGWNGTIFNASFPCARTCPAATLFTIPVKSYNRTCGSASGVNCA